MLKMCVKFCGTDEHDDRESRTKKELARAPASLDLSLQSRDVSVRIVHAGGQEELYENVVPASQLMEKYPGMCIARPEVFKNPQGSLLWPDENLLPGQKYYIIPSTTAQKLKHKHLEKGEVKRIAEVKRSAKVERTADVKIGTPDVNITWDVDTEISNEFVYSAKDFFVSGESLPRQSARKSPQQSPRRSPRQSPKRSPRQLSGQSPRQSPRRSPRQPLGQLPKQLPRQLPRRNGRGGRVKKPFVPPLPRIRTCRGVDWEPSLTSVQEVSP